jgi:N-acetylneuraminic acid mutarotase
MRICRAGFAFAVLATLPPGGVHSHTRGLSFEERLKCQEAIDRVYYSHQIGEARSFEEAVPRSLLESKVRTYLKQSVALEEFWKTSMTDEMLGRELQRMAAGTKLPDRLLEVYAALGNDPFLIKECVARPTLVDRLSRNFFAFDTTIHDEARLRAEKIRRQLEEKKLDPTSDHPERSVVEMSVKAPDESRQGEAFLHRARDGKPATMDFSPEEYRTQRSRWPAAVGEVSNLEEGREAFVVRVVLSDAQDGMRAAVYHVPKTAWEEWWPKAASRLDAERVEPMAQEGGVPPRPAIRAESTAGNGRRGEEAAPGSGTSPALPCGPIDNTWDNGILDDVPDPRSQATTVWTGSLMVVWGGLSGTKDLNTGGRYDPATDSWTPTASTNAPSPRSGHTAIWTGTHMVVWGGNEGGGTYGSLLQTGGRYDPVADTWTPTSISNAPSGRNFHTAVWTGSLMVVWGGLQGVPLATGGRYDPIGDTWAPTSTADAPAARYQHTAIWTGGLMVVWGGWGLNTGGRYDPGTDTWTPTSTTDAPSGRAGHTAIWTGNLMVIWGGSDLNTGGRYDPATDTWMPTSTVSAPGGRSGHTAIWTGSLMVIWGGTRGPSFVYGWRYDPAADTWTQASNLNGPTGRTGHTAIWTGNLMVVWGGVTGVINSFSLNTGGRYDPVMDAWTPISSGGAPSARYSHTAIWTGSLMVVWGGTGAFSANFNTGGRYDPVTDIWTPTSTANAPSARYLHKAVWTGSLMIVWGGAAQNGVSLATGGRYDPNADIWAPTSTANAPTARYQHTAIWTGGLMVVWGGSPGGFSALNTGGRYDPSTDAWTSVNSANAPSARTLHSAVWTGSQMVVWGGSNGGVSPVFFNTGGLYDPATDTWTQTSTSNAPSTRSGHSSVWTGSRMVVWGGGNGSIAFNTGGRYDPAANAWTPTSTTNAPSSRSSHTAIWTGNLMVVWGGSGLNTGGRYDPGTDTWTPTSTAGAPAARSSHTALWLDGVMAIWGGWDGGGYLSSGGQVAVSSFTDNDGDGYLVCSGDCDDTDPGTYPGAPQLCDGVNSDCNDPAWPAVPSNEADADSDGYRICTGAGDCDDADASVYPSAPQLCDGKNNNCSDPSWPVVSPNEADADSDGSRVCAGDCNDTNAAVHPGAAEACNGVDDDCSGLIDDDLAGLDSDSDGIHNTCDNCRFSYNPTQLDSDHDGIGNACDNCISVTNGDQADLDSDQRGDLCDNCPDAYNPLQEDGDGDKLGDVCDNCIGDFNPDRADFDHDGEGDVCDVNDGMILVFADDPSLLRWQQEVGPTVWNVYRGAISVLRSTGVYTQVPGSNPSAEQICGVQDDFVADSATPGSGEVVFTLVTGVQGVSEWSLGTNSAGAPRPNSNPCP